jgi:hypothetical protein
MHVVWSQGEVVELIVGTKGLKECVAKLHKVLKRYRDRVEWLNKGENNITYTLLGKAEAMLLPVCATVHEGTLRSCSSQCVPLCTRER